MSNEAEKENEKVHIPHRAYWSWQQRSVLKQYQAKLEYYGWGHEQQERELERVIVLWNW